jgi:TrmH family RNA methyltransferase
VASPVITSLHNPRIVEARKLRQRKYRHRQGRFLVGDVTLLHMALEAGARPLEVFYCESQLTATDALAVLERLRRSGAEPVAVSPRVMEALAEHETPQGLAATFALFEVAPGDVPLAGCELVVVVDRLQDPGNLGTLIRTADAVGAAAVVLIEPCVDPFDPKTVRGTMGSLFNVPLARTSDVAGLFSDLSEKGLRLVGADAQQGRAWGAGLWEGGVALVVGNEARGLSRDVRPFIQAWARLPIAGKAESLNVAVAGGVFMYTWLRANLREQGGNQECASGAQQHVGQNN